MNKKFLTPRNPDLFPLIAERVNMLHPTLVGLTVNTVAHPYGVFLEDSGDYVADWIPGGSESSPGDFCTLGGTIQAPDGSLTGRKIVEAATNQTHSMVSGFLLRSGRSYTGGVTQCVYRFRKSVFVKAAERTRVVLALADSVFTRYTSGGGQNPVFGFSGTKAVFDLANGAVAVVNTAFGTGWEAGAASITAFKRGWYRCTIEGIMGAWYQSPSLLISGVGGPVHAYLYLDAGSGNDAENSSYSGNGTSGVYAWKANCLPQRAFDLTERVFYDDFLDYSTIDTLDTKAPGFNWYVDRGHIFRQPTSLRKDVDYSVSNSELNLHLAADNTFQPHMFSVVTDGTDTGYIGNTFTVPALFEGRVRSDVQPLVPAQTYGYSYWTSGAEGLFAPFGVGTWPLVESVEWDFLEPGPIVGISTGTEVVPNFNAHNYLPGAIAPPNEQSTFQLGITFPYTVYPAAPDFTEHHNFACLLTPQATGTPAVGVGQRNALSNTAWADAVVGTPGTLPAHMSIDPGAVTGIAVDVVAIAAGKLKLRFHGTAVLGAGSPSYFLNLNSTPFTSGGGTLAPGQVWTGSLQLRLSAGAFTNIVPKLVMIEYQAGGTVTDGGNAGRNTIITGNDGVLSVLTRVSMTYRVMATGTARLQFALFWQFFGGEVVDATFKLFEPQLERSAMPTAFQASGGADPVVIQGLTLAQAEPYFGQTYVFFDGTHMSDMVYSSHTFLTMTNPAGSWIISDTLHFPFIFNATLATWPSHWDWVQVIK